VRAYMKFRKYIIIVTLGILIFFVLSFINGFAGNPVSKLLVNQAAQKYVEEHYADFDLTMNKAVYNFKDGKYHVNVKSKTSIDTHFSIAFSGTGKFIDDEYNELVLSKWNTGQRIDDAYRKLADTVLESEDFPYDSDIAFGEMLDKGISTDDLEIDKKYDIKELAKEKGHIVLYVYSNTLDVPTLTQTLLDVKKLFDAKDVPFNMIDLTLQLPRTEERKTNDSIITLDFLYQDIYADGLQGRVQNNVDKTKAYYQELDKEKNAEMEK